MFQIIPYQAEIDLGLGDKIRQSTSFSYLAPIIPSKENVEIDPKIIQFLQSSDKFDKIDSVDLYSFSSILVSTIWNKNDEFFMKRDTWNARYTAEDKPMNFEHEPEMILGHMVGSMPVDDEGKELTNVGSIDDLPSTYHILTNNVIYRYFADEDKLKARTKLIEEIKAGDWFVSVEALFFNFDYALRDSANNIQIVERNKKTAHLSQYLRILGGNGIYHDKRIARVPRNFIFSGVGLVKKPANPGSVIFASEFSENIIVEALDNLVYSENSKGENMDEKVLKDLQDKNEILTKELDGAKTSMKTTLAELETLKASLKSLEEAKVALEKEKTEIASKNAELVAKVDVFEKEKKVNVRVDALVAKLSLSKESAQDLVNDLVDLSDEKFNSYVEKQVKLVTAAKQAAVPEQKPEQTVNAKVLDEAKPNQETTLNVVQASDQNGVNNKVTVNKIADLFRKVADESYKVKGR